MERKFKIGEDVIYINENGVNWGRRKIIGYDTRTGENTYYIDPTDTPWFSVREENLHKEIYIDREYKGSEAYNTVITATKEQLEYRMGYTKNAIQYHIKNNNPGQVKFFTDELKLIEKRLKQYNKRSV